jgi:hypothetical protein
VVTLPKDPRETIVVAPPLPDEGSAWPATPASGAVPADLLQGADPIARPDAEAQLPHKVEVSSPTATPPVNPDAAPLAQEPAPGATGQPIAPESPSTR